MSIGGAFVCSFFLLSCSSGPSSREQTARFHESFPATILPDVGTYARFEMRHKHNVRELDPAESGLMLFEVPGGIFAFVRFDDIYYRYDKETRLRRKHVQHEDFELHKMANGSVALVGFVTNEVAAQLDREAIRKRLDVTLYSDPWALASTLVAMPFSDKLFIRAKRHLELDNGRGPAALDIELILESDQTELQWGVLRTTRTA